ncbi:MAG: ABC transporter ATP-binding protein [Desulfamplus sp.]|nr:ABC transporter ATP-binding protein [Desulfamplus sp.]
MDITPPAIEASALTKRFGDIIAVDNLSFKVNPGEIFGLVGPDGAGKSTTLRMLSSIMDPTSGSAAIAGYDVITEADLVKDQLAYMSQKFGLYPDLSVMENINFYADLYGVSRKGRSTKIDELLNFSQMRPFKKRRAANLSGGMKQKLQLVCALIHTPRVLLLDEPTNGVDPVSRRDFWKILYRLLKESVSILVTTAYLDEAERCDRIGLIDHGKMIAIGNMDEIRRLMNGRILSIRSTEARLINRILRSNRNIKSKGFINVNLFGDRVHVVSSDIVKTEHYCRLFLDNAGIEYKDMKEIIPSLEDVFVSMLDNDDRQRDPDKYGSDKTEQVLESTDLESTDTERTDPETSDIATTSVHGDQYSHSMKERLSKAVTVNNLTRRFGDFIAVNNISFDVPKGQIFGFLGPNGAGKSTTIRMLCGLLEPTEGDGTVAGFNVRNQSEEIKQHIGYMSQKFSLYEDLTVEENINFYGGIYGLKDKRLETRKEWAIEMAGLKDHRKSLTKILSGGWKQRLALACAILHEPPIIFLDEPTSGVDPISRRAFWDLIYEMAEHGITIFVTTHYMDEAEYCDRIALIYGGEMIAMGTPMELKSRLINQREAQNREHNVVATEDKFTTTADNVTGIGDKAAHMEHKIAGTEGKNIDIIPNMEDVFISLIEEVDQKKNL